MDAAAFPGARHLGGHWYVHFFGGESDREYVTGIDWEDVVQLFLVRLEKLPQLFRPFVFSVFLDDLGKS